MRILPLILLLVTLGCDQEDESPPAGPDAGGGNPSGTATANPSPPTGKVTGVEAAPWTDAETDRKTESGLRYKVLKEGEGQAPGMGDLVTVHYTGWLVTGKEFDSSRTRGEPAEFILGQVIPGWNEGVQLMKTGARYKFHIPWKLAYGAAGRPPRIPPQADLVFDVELLAVKELPKHRALDPEKAQKTESGIEYEIVKAGEGENPGADDIVELDYFVWNGDGDLIISSNVGPPLAGKCGDLRLTRLNETFLKEAAALLREGGEARFVVPPELCWKGQAVHPAMPANSVSHWLLTLKKVSVPPPMPQFRMLKADAAKTTDSGLKYEVIQEGAGPQPKRTDRVSVFYTGWLTNGTEFDSAHRRGSPTTFGVTQVIPGWIEGLQLMRPGGVYLFEIPSNLAYGARGQGKIPPNSTLIFLVELVSIE